MYFHYKYSYAAIIISTHLTLITSIIIVQSYEDDTITTSGAHVISINISRQIIHNEVNHNVKEIKQQIQNIEATHENFVSTFARKTEQSHEKIQKLEKELDSKLDIFCEMVNYQQAMENEIKVLKQKLEKFSNNLSARDNRTASPPWVKKYKEDLKSKREKTSLKSKTSQLPFHKKNSSINLRLKQTLQDIKQNSCNNGLKNFSFLGVPPWVVSIKLDIYKARCDHEKMQKLSKQTSPIVEKDNKNNDEATSFSKKSTKRKIDEVFLKLMLRSKKLSWIDIERIGENIALFVDHVEETSKLCVASLFIADWESLEDCKEKIGMNFTMSILMAVVCTVTMTTFFLVFLLFLMRLKVFLSDVLSKRSTFKFKFDISKITSCLEVISGKLKSLTDFVKTRKFNDADHPTSSLRINDKVCVVTTSDASQQAADNLITRLIQSDSELPLKAKPSYQIVETISKIRCIPKAPKTVLLINLDELSNEVIFEEFNGKPGLNFRIIEALNSTTDLMLLCINDKDSKLLPKGRFYNKLLISNNDNYLLRSLARHNKIISINKLFTASQAKLISLWLQNNDKQN